MSTNMRDLLREGVMIWVPLDICLIESFQMSTNMRGLLCEGVMIWVPLNNRSLRAGKEYSTRNHLKQAILFDHR